MSVRRLLPLCALVGLVALGGSPAQAAYPGVNGNLLFSRTAASFNTSHLYTVGADGSDPFELLSEPTFDDDASYSPDGSRVVFERCDNNCGIAIANADGSNVQQLTPDDGSTHATDDYPAFSPDGSKIVFGRQGSGASEIWVMGSDGSDAHKILDGDATRNLQARFSPDGSKIAYIDASAAVAVANSDGSGSHEIDVPPSGADEFPDWSPDGSRLAFTRSDSSASIWVVPSDGSAAAVQLMDPGSGMNDSEPAFSPDGTKIAFERYPDGDDVQSIYVAGADGSGATRVTCEDCWDFHAEWRPLHPAPVPPPPAPPVSPPAFGGVKLAVARITVPASGLIRIAESCPASAKSSCTGTLTLKTAGAVVAKSKKKRGRVLTLGKAHFSIPAGKTVKVKLRISKAGMKLLRSHKTLRTVARVVSHDGSGASKSSTGRLVLKAPKQRKHHH